MDAAHSRGALAAVTSAWLWSACLPTQSPQHWLAKQPIPGEQLSSSVVLTEMKLKHLWDIDFSSLSAQSECLACSSGLQVASQFKY